MRYKWILRRVFEAIVARRFAEIIGKPREFQQSVGLNKKNSRIGPLPAPFQGRKAWENAGSWRSSMRANGVKTVTMGTNIA
jgi:hypothetical protein